MLDDELAETALPARLSDEHMVLVDSVRVQLDGSQFGFATPQIEARDDLPPGPWPLSASVALGSRIKVRGRQVKGLLNRTEQVTQPFQLGRIKRAAVLVEPPIGQCLQGIDLLLDRRRTSERSPLRTFLGKADVGRVYDPLDGPVPVEDPCTPHTNQQVILSERPQRDRQEEDPCPQWDACAKIGRAHV